MTNYFDLISLTYCIICIQFFWQLSQNWSKFWDDQVSLEDKRNAALLANLVLIPIGVLLHEVGHALATLQVGGTVSAFQ